MPKLASTLRPRTIDIKDVICDIEAKYLTEQEKKNLKTIPSRISSPVALVMFGMPQKNTAHKKKYQSGLIHYCT